MFQKIVSYCFQQLYEENIKLYQALWYKAYNYEIFLSVTLTDYAIKNNK